MGETWPDCPILLWSSEIVGVKWERTEDHSEYPELIIIMEAELWSSVEDREDVSEAGRREQWHFQNALFEDIRNMSTSKPCKSNINSSMSRRRYSCLACGEIKRWDQLTQHYKVSSVRLERSLI